MSRSKIFSFIVQMSSILILVLYPVLVYASTVSDTDCTAEFDSGTDSDTQCSSGQVELDATGKTNGSGNFTSRIFNGGSSLTWSTIAWTPYQPYMKELPDSKAIESAYGVGNLNMTNNLLLLHLNESSGATSFTDSSGSLNTGSCDNGSGKCPTVTTSGKFNNAFTFDGGNDEIQLASQAVSSLIGAQFTIAFWFNPGGTQDRPTFGFAGSGSANKSNPVASYDSFINIGNGSSWQLLTAFPDAAINTWTHYALVDDGSDYVAYVNGIEVSRDPISVNPTSATNRVFTIGESGFSAALAQWTAGSFDEFVIFSEGLAGDDILAMYKRGANLLKFQVRSCDDGACSGENFIGPDGSTGTYYSELTDASNALPSKTLSNVLDNQYFQYKAFLETSSTTLTPALLDVTITYASSIGVPEFSDGVYVATMLFVIFYIAQRKEKIFQ